MERIREAVKDLRFLLGRGYPRTSAVTFISNHYRLPSSERHLLWRCVFADDEIRAHMERRVRLGKIKGKRLGVDGYNVLITVESILSGRMVVRCDDGFIRDLRAVFGKYRISRTTRRALMEILGTIRRGKPREAFIFYDRQVSRSGELASMTRRLMEELGIPGDAAAVGAVDYLLRDFEVVATSDGAIIGKARAVWDIPAEIGVGGRAVLDLRAIR